VTDRAASDAATEVVKYDDFGWHAGALEKDFDRAFVHIGVYLAWLANHRLLDEQGELLGDPPTQQVIQSIRDRNLTGSAMKEEIDGKFTSDILTEEGRRFTDWYYRGYLGDFDAVLGYHGMGGYSAEDSWKTYDLVTPVIDKAYTKWVDAGRPSPRRARRRLSEAWRMRVLKGYGVLVLIGLVVIGFRLTDVPVAIVAALVLPGALCSSPSGFRRPLARATGE
jgi:hypothetical protein